jgi:hypothetical protein
MNILVGGNNNFFLKNLQKWELGIKRMKNIGLA